MTGGAITTSYVIRICGKTGRNETDTENGVAYKYYYKHPISIWIWAHGLGKDGRVTRRIFRKHNVIVEHRN